MIESSKPMSDGRSPTSVGQVAILRDGGIYAFPVTNREVFFPYYPTEAKGYIAQGYGPNLEITSFNSFNGVVNLSSDGEDARIVDNPGVSYFVYNTPKFQAVVIQGDVINKPWRGVAMKLSCERTTTVYEYPNPPVSTIITVNFSHTFTTDDDPVVGSPNYITPNASYRTLYGVEYLAYADEPGKVTTTSQTAWLMTETTPP
jgi:hypothetical protein